MIRVYFQDSAHMDAVENGSVQFAVSSFPGISIKTNIYHSLLPLKTKREMMQANMRVDACKKLLEAWCTQFYLPSMLEVERALTFDGVFFLNIGFPDWTNSKELDSYFRTDLGVLYPYLVAENILQNTGLRLRWDYLSKIKSVSGTRIEHWFQFSKGTEVKDNHVALPSILEGTTQQIHGITPFPREILELLLEKFTDEGDWVLDAFAGLCTLGVVAENMKRNSILYENNLNNAYFVDEFLKDYAVQYQYPYL